MLSRNLRGLASCLALLLGVWAPAAVAVKVLAVPAPYHVYEAVAGKDTIGAFLNDHQGRRLGSFVRLQQHVANQGRRLQFAMNGGIYQQGGAPLGLLVVDGRQVHAVNRRTKAHGNFYLQPNGVFLVGARGPRIVTTQEYPVTGAHGVQQATQSGPLLVINGKRNDQLPIGASLIRNGVGVRGNTVYFVMTDAGVTFHEFADFFSEVLHCTDALYLDGNISGAWLAGAAGVGNVSGNAFGPLLGIRFPAEE